MTAEVLRARRGVAVPAGRVLDATAWGLLAVVVAWAPLPYASNHPWAWVALATAVSLVLALLGLARLLRGSAESVPAVVGVAAACTALAWGWAGLQALPAGAGWAGAHEVWDEIAGYGLAGEALVGLGREAALDALVRLVAYGGAFWAVFLLLLGQGERARRALTGFVVVSAAYAAYGLLNHFAGWETVLWEEGRKAYAGYVTSTFVNRNSYATYANLGVLAALGLLLEPFLKARSGGDAKRIAVEVAEKLVARRGPLLLALVLLVTAMLLTGSRGGFLSLAVAFAVMLLLVLGVTRPRAAVMAPAVGGAVLAAWALVWVSGGTTLERLDATDATLAMRTLIYEDTLRMIADRPLTGHGYGSYERAFPAYQELSVNPLSVDKAHNTYLEHAAELGIPATVLLYLGPLLLFGYCVRGVFVRRKDQVFPLVAASASVLVAVHALVDFSLQIPAVAVTYAVLLGMGVAQSTPSPRRRRPGASLRE